MASLLDRLKQRIPKIHGPPFWQVSGILVLVNLGCADADSRPSLLTADMPLHLEEHLDDATIVGFEVPADIPEPVEWRFDEPQPEWRPAKPIPAQLEAVNPVQADDALRLPLTARNRAAGGEARRSARSRAARRMCKRKGFAPSTING